MVVSAIVVVVLAAASVAVVVLLVMVVVEKAAAAVRYVRRFIKVYTRAKIQWALPCCPKGGTREKNIERRGERAKRRVLARAHTYVDFLRHQDGGL